MHPILEMLKRVQDFMDDMEKVNVHVEIKDVRITLDIQPKGNDEEGGDEDEKRTDAQR